MAWLDHPAYARLRDRLIDRFRGRVFTFGTLRTLVFLGGGAGSSIRDQIATYLRKHTKNILVFYAEHVWEHISGLPGLNALAVEDQLGLVADAIIILVESAGTCAELGAFSARAALRRKLLPILDISHKGENSFINNGPIRWVDTDSAFRPSLYVDFADFFELAQSIEARLKLLRSSEEERVSDIAASPKHLLFLLCDLVAIIGPATSQDCSFYLKGILSVQPKRNLPSLLGLAVSLGLLRHFDYPGSGERLYYRPVKNDELLPFQHNKMFDLSEERAKFLSVLQGIDEGRTALKYMSAL